MRPRSIPGDPDKSPHPVFTLVARTGRVGGESAVSRNHFSIRVVSHLYLCICCLALAWLVCVVTRSETFLLPASSVCTTHGASDQAV